MVNEEDFGLFSYRIFRKFAKKYAKKVFGEIRNDLHKSGIRMTLEEYFSTMLLVESIAAPLILIISFFVALALTDKLVLSIGISFIVISGGCSNFHILPQSIKHCCWKGLKD